MRTGGMRELGWFFALCIAIVLFVYFVVGLGVACLAGSEPLASVLGLFLLSVLLVVFVSLLVVMHELLSRAGTG